LIDNHDPGEPLPSGDVPPLSQGSRSNTAISTRRLRRLGLATAAIALLIAVAGIADRQFNERAVAKWTSEQAVPEVSVILPQHGVSGTQLVLPGNVQAWFEAPIYSRVSGYLKKWNFDYGAHVKQNQVLATIDTPDLDAQFAAAKADLDAARAKVNSAKAAMEFSKSTYDRWRDSPKGVVSLQETESKKADYETALASYDAALAGVKSDQGVVDRLQALEQFKRIVAPFDGVVIERNTDIGDLINAGSGAGGGTAPQLFRIADVHRMRIFVQVPQAMSSEIANGMTADLTLPQYSGRSFKAVVATTARAINPTSRTLLVELQADNANDLLQPGTYTEVHFNLPADPQILTIPTTALVFRRSGLQVAVVNPQGRAELKTIQVGRNLGDKVEILTGLSASDRVIDSPPDSIENGELLSVANSSQPALRDEMASVAGDRAARAVTADSSAAAVKAPALQRASTLGARQ
jgi:RND family efflux transporter MFP subunit